MLFAIFDERMFSWRSGEEAPDLFDPGIGPNIVLTFERNGKRYRRKWGDCDLEHVNAVMRTMKAHIEIEQELLRRERETISIRQNSADTYLPKR